MFLSETGLAGKHIEHGAVDNEGLPLGMVFRDLKNLKTVWVNNRPISDWRAYIPRRGDRVNVFTEAEGLETAVIMAIIQVTIALISTVLSLTVFAPKKPKANGDKTASYGIVGFQNTTGQGTPILRAYGINRLYPHVIASGVDLIDGRTMVGKVLYCVGASDDNGWESLSDVLINDVPADQYDGLQVHYRLGTPDQTVVPGFEDSYQVWNVNQEIPADSSAVVYQTKADDVNLIKPIFSFPSGLWKMNSTGHRREDFVDLWIEISPDNATWLTVEPIPAHRSPLNATWWRYRESIQTNFYDGLLIDTSFSNTAANNRYWADYPDVAASPNYGTGVPGGAWKHYNENGRDEGRIWHSELQSGAQYWVRFRVMAEHEGDDNESHSTTIYLFDVEERVYGARAYPNRVLLGLTGIPAKQVPSLESLKVSVLARCQKVKEYLDPGGLTYNLHASQKRCWNVAHFLTDKRIGMGYEVDISEIPISQWYTEAQSYYDELVPAQAGGFEPRDHCDWVISERRWDWEHVRSCVGEGRGVLFPSGGFWKWVVDKPGAPQLLFSEPGNIVEGSITMEISQPDRPWNQIIAEFRDEADHYRPGITQPTNGPEYPYPSTIQEAITFDTITRESQAIRECMVMLKRQFLEKRRWTFTSPQNAIIKEPLDLDWLSERTLGDEGAFTGFVVEGSSTTTVVLDREVELDGVSTYLLIVQHRDGSIAETRTVTTGAGKHVAISVMSPFAKLPAAMDVYAVGAQNVDHIVTRLRDMTIDNEGRVQQVRTEYIEEVYDPDPLPPSINRKIFPYGASLPPLPLQAAAAVSQLVLNADGSWRTVILFDVTPSMTIHSGTTFAAIAWSSQDFSILDTTFERGGPEAQGLFVGADYYPDPRGADGQAGLYRRIVRYDGPTFRAYFDSPFPNFISNSQYYEIRWPKFGEFDGFKVERSQDNIQYAELARFKGIHGEIDGGDQSGTWFFRFTPFNPGSIENKTAPIIKQVTLIGDTSAPRAPLSIGITSQYKTVTAVINIALPMAEDTKNLDIEYYQRTDAIGNLQGVFVSSPAVTRVPGTSGTWPVVSTVNLVHLNYGATIVARARAVDYSGNASPWTNFSNDVALSQVITPDIGAGAIATIVYYVSGTEISIVDTNQTPQPPPTPLVFLSIQTIGGSIDLEAKVRVKYPRPGGATEGAPPETANDVISYLVAGTVWDTNLILDQVTSSGMLIAAVNRSPGVHDFSLWAWGGGSITNVKFKIQENRGGY